MRESKGERDQTKVEKEALGAEAQGSDASP